MVSVTRSATMRTIETPAELPIQVGVLCLVAGEAVEELPSTGLFFAMFGRISGDCLDPSSRDMPIPLSDTVMVRALGRSSPDPELRIVLEELGWVNASKRSLSQASEAFEISSRRKISLLLYQGVNHQAQQLLDLGLEAEVSRSGIQSCGPPNV